MKFVMPVLDATVTVSGNHGKIHFTTTPAMHEHDTDRLLQALNATESHLNRKIISFTPERDEAGTPRVRHITHCWFTLAIALQPTECEIDEPARR